MASLENRTGYFSIVFRFGGSKFTRSLKTNSKREAQGRKLRLEENIRLVESGRLEIPANADVATFLLSDGKVDRRITLGDALTLQAFFDAFFDAVPDDNLEPTTLSTMSVHKRHFERHLGARYPVRQLVLADLQAYVAKRTKDPGRRGRKVGANTISKEIATFRSVWNWAADQGKLHGVFPRKGLRLPKTKEHPRFQTWHEIERQIRRGGLSQADGAELWDCLYLSRQETEELLLHVDNVARQPFLYPMFVMAAHTGARRSELLRSHVGDFDGDEVVIHERKRIRGQHSTRRVPMSSALRLAISNWLRQHPGGLFTFCLAGHVHRSKKKRPSPQPLTRDEANDHFQRTLRGSKWAKIKGWHCLRHSFISNLASQGVDQRLIDSYVGHTTESMRRRYTHLFPDTKKAAIKHVFG